MDAMCHAPPIMVSSGVALADSVRTRLKGERHGRLSIEQAFSLGLGSHVAVTSAASIGKRDLPTLFGHLLHQPRGSRASYVRLVIWADSNLSHPFSSQSSAGSSRSLRAWPTGHTPVRRSMPSSCRIKSKEADEGGWIEARVRCPRFPPARRRRRRRRRPPRFLPPPPFLRCRFRRLAHQACPAMVNWMDRAEIVRDTSTLPFLLLLAG